MRLMHDPVRKHIAERIHAAILIVAPEFQNSIPEIYDSLVEPPNSDLGDLAFGTFSLAKALKKGPPQISAQLAPIIQQAVTPDSAIESCVPVGPYLNIKIKTKSIGEGILEPIRTGSYFQRKLTAETLRTMIEYSQPNTHKEMHVGHMRNLCLGDALVRLLRYSGYTIITATFPGDMGTHVAKCLWYMKYHNQDPVPDHQKGEWLGSMYSRAHIKLEDEENTPQGSINKDQLTSIIKELERKDGEFFDLWIETRRWSLDLMKSVYDWAGVEFDYWYFESEVDTASVQFVKQLYAENKLIVSEGAIGMDLSEDKLGFCLLLKTDGTGLYATKDIELARRKFQDVHIEKNIYVVDMRQEFHFKQVFKVLEKIGFPQAKNCHHLQYNYVELPDGAMSSRKGNIVPLGELVHRMEQMVKENFLARYLDEWTETEIDSVAKMVAKGAIRYGMVRIDTNKKIVFDMNEWLKIDGESGPFIQYSYARVSSLCKKLGYDERTKVEWNVLAHSAELGLAKSLMHFNSIVVASAEGYKPNSVCTYLYEVAKRFNLFYHECPIGTAENEDLKRSRLALSFCTGQILKKGLELLGIPASERM